MLLDIFNNDAFTLASMSAAIDQHDYVPQGIMGSGVFNPNPVRTETVGIEKRDTGIAIVDFSQRGEKRQQRDKTALRQMVHVATPRLSLTTTIRASELQFLREFGTEDQILQAQKEIARRQFGPNGLVADIDFSLERMALSALLSGNVLDAQGNVLYDYSGLLGFPAAPDITLNLTTLSDGNLRKEVTQKVARPMKRAARGARYQGIKAWCGKTAFDRLMANPEFYKTFETQQAGAELREGYLGQETAFGGVMWQEYWGDDNDVVKVADEEVVFVPWGQNNIYQHVMSPAEDFASIGALGQKLYSRVVPDRDRNEFVEVDVDTYSLCVNTRPDLKIRCSSTNS